MYKTFLIRRKNKKMVLRPDCRGQRQGQQQEDQWEGSCQQAHQVIKRAQTYHIIFLCARHCVKHMT